ncbi:MAG: ankyrin repeat domain-containing protein [Planctomycetaceae bacterium]
MFRAAGAEPNLISAIHLDELAKIKALLAKNPEYADDYQRTSPLRIAASLGRLRICNHLIKQHDVDVDDFKRGNGYPIIRDAVGHPNVVKLLIDSGADLKTRISWRGFQSGIWPIGNDATALHFAATRSGHHLSVQHLLHAGVDVMAVTAGNRTALGIAASHGQLNAARLILDHSSFKRASHSHRHAVLNRSLSSAVGSLPWDSSEEQVEQVAFLLLEAGADPNSEIDGQTPLQTTASHIWPNQLERNTSIRRVIDKIVEHGATLDLYTAVSINDLEAVTRLAGSEKNLNRRYGREWEAQRTLLEIAVLNGHQEIVQALLKAGCDPNTAGNGKINDFWETALHTAAGWSRFDIAQILIQAGADVKAPNGAKSTPLHTAAYAGDLEMVRLLLKSGANALALDIDGKTARQVARSSDTNSTRVQKLLAEFEQTLRERQPKSKAM